LAVVDERISDDRQALVQQALGLGDEVFGVAFGPEDVECVSAVGRAGAELVIEDEVFLLEGFLEVIVFGIVGIAE
jgi:hypothetical protein